MAGRKPEAYLVAVFDAPEGEGKATFKRLGPLWKGEKPGTYGGNVESIPTEWLGGGPSFRVIVQLATTGGGNGRR